MDDKNGITSSDVVMCPKCSTPHRNIPLDHGQHARCSTCSKVLYRCDKNAMDKIIAYAVAGLILFVVANSFALIRIDVIGQSGFLTLPGTILSLVQNGFYLVAFATFFLIMFFPAWVLMLYATVGILMKRSKGSFWVQRMLVTLSKIQKWDMLDIFFISILVALVKLFGYAQVHLGASLWALGAVVAIELYLSKAYPPHQLWHWYERIYSGNTVAM